MLWFFIFPVFAFVLATWKYKDERTGIILLLLLLFFSMFRGDEVGTDTQNYMEKYDLIANLFLYDANYTFEGGRTELLYYYLCSFIYLNGYSPRWIIYIFSLITYIFIYLGCRRMKVNMAYFALFFVLSTMYIVSFNIARQFAAISICFFSVSFLFDKGLKQYFFLIGVGVSFFIHSSSILFVPLYFLKNVSLDRTKVGWIIYVLSIIAIFAPITEVAFEMFARLGILERYSEKYGAASDRGLSSLGIINYIYKTIIFTIYFLIYRARNNEKKTDLYDNLYLSFFLLQGCFASDSNLATYRIKFSFMILMCLYFSMVFIKMNDDKRALYYLYSLIAFALCVRVSLGYGTYYMQFNL